MMLFITTIKYFGINHLMDPSNEHNYTTQVNCLNEEFFTSVDYLLNHKYLKGLFKF